MGYKDIIFEAAAKEQGLSWITVVENGETSTLSVCREQNARLLFRV